MNDPLNWVALALTVLLSLPTAIEGYKHLLKKYKRQRTPNH